MVGQQSTQPRTHTKGGCVAQGICDFLRGEGVALIAKGPYATVASICEG